MKEDIWLEIYTLRTYLEHVKLASGFLASSILTMIMGEKEDVFSKTPNMRVLVHEIMVNEIRIKCMPAN